MTEPSPDPVEAMFRSSQPYLEDQGFTQRVLLALPPPRAARARSRVLALFATAAVLTLAFGPALGGALELLRGAVDLGALAQLAMALSVLTVTALSVALREAER